MDLDNEKRKRQQKSIPELTKFLFSKRKLGAEIMTRIFIEVAKNNNLVETKTLEAVHTNTCASL